MTLAGKLFLFGLGLIMGLILFTQTLYAHNGSSHNHFNSDNFNSKQMKKTLVSSKAKLYWKVKTDKKAAHLDSNRPTVSTSAFLKEFLTILQDEFETEGGPHCNACICISCDYCPRHPSEPSTSSKCARHPPGISSCFW